MIDYRFYRELSDQTIDQMYVPGHYTADELLHLVESHRSDLPYVDQIETTNNCNMRCRMCPRATNMTRGIIKSMRRELFERIMDELNIIEQEKAEQGISISDFKADPPRDLMWNGSEFDIGTLRLHHFGAPLLDPQITDRVKYINKNTGFQAQLSEIATNLQLKKILELFRHRLARLVIALDGTNAEEFERNRGRKINFRKAVDKVNRVVEMKVNGDFETAVHIQLIKLGDASNKRFIEMWGDIPGLDILHKPFFPYPDIDQSIGTREDHVFDAKCRIPLVSMTILADGRVVPCNADYNGEEVLGNLNHQSLMEIWHGEPFKKFREKFIKSQFTCDDLCNRCGFYPFKNYAL